MAERVKVAEFDKLEEGMKKRILVGDQPIMLCKVEGNIYAINDTCTHAKASLSAGKLCAFQIECAWHGARFDVRTGEVKALPAAMPVKKYAVIVEGNDVFIEI